MINRAIWRKEFADAGLPQPSEEFLDKMERDLMTHRAVGSAQVTVAAIVYWLQEEPRPRP